MARSLYVVKHNIFIQICIEKLCYSSQIFSIFLETLLLEFNIFLYNLLHVLKNLIQAALFVFPVFFIMSMSLIYPEYSYNHSHIDLCIFSSLTFSILVIKLSPVFGKTYLMLCINLYFYNYHIIT
jgi:hypothetical protein